MSGRTAPPEPPRGGLLRTGSGILLLGAGLLLHELCLTRILSVLFYYHTAFLAISVALLGLAAGGLWVHLRPTARPGREAALTALAALTICLLPPLLPGPGLTPEELERLGGRSHLLALSSVVLVCLLPYLCGGAALASLLQTHRGHVGRLYAANLGGAALGTMLLVPAMGWLGGPGALLACAVLVAGASLLLPGPGNRWRLLVLLGALGLTCLQVARDPFAIQVDLGEPGQPPARILHKRWNAFSRVVVLEDRGWHRGLSEERWEFWRDRGIPEQVQALIDINAYAPVVRFDGDPGKVRFLRDLISNLGLHLQPRGARVAILGPGGGKDVLGALLFDPSRVLGLELNPILVEDLLQDRLRHFAGDLYRHPRVEVRVGDARTALRRLDERFDLILLNSVATWAAHASGALSLSEQTLFTREACALYHDRLVPDGILSVSQWDGDPHLLTRRWLATCARVGVDRGLAPLRERAVVIGNPWDRGRWFTTVLVRRSPFPGDQLRHLERLCRRLGFRPLYLPTEGATTGLPELQALLQDPGAAIAASPHDLEPATDDRPFFLYTLRWREALQVWRPRAIPENLAYTSLLASLLVVTLLVVALLLLPLWWSRRRPGARITLRPGELLYFALIGAGFMLIEIPLMQRCTLLLGHPTYALTVVLFGLLLWSGLGSAWAQRWVATDAATGRGRALLAGVAVLTAPLWLGLPHLLERAMESGTGTGIAVALIVLLPPGLCMGTALPLGLERLGLRQPRAIAWAWGVNGAAGVLASVLALVIALLWGFTMALGAGACCYLLAALTLPWPSPASAPG